MYTDLENIAIATRQNDVEALVQFFGSTIS